MGSVLPGQGRRQAQPMGGRVHQPYPPVARRREVVDLVEDQEAKPVTDALRPDARRVVGGHCYCPDIPAAASEDADLDPEILLQAPAPLIHQDQGRDHDEGRLAKVLHGLQRHDRLPSTRGEDNDAATPSLPPGLQGLLLVVPELDARVQVRAGRAPIYLVPVFQAFSLQVLDYLPIPQGGSHVRIRIGVVPTMRDGTTRRQDAALIVSEDYQRRPSEDSMNVSHPNE